jgi:hypothetical protein
MMFKCQMISSGVSYTNVFDNTGTIRVRFFPLLKNDTCIWVANGNMFLSVLRVTIGVLKNGISLWMPNYTPVVIERGNHKKRGLNLSPLSCELKYFRQ